MTGVQTCALPISFGPGTHASTFGANPLATAAANYVLDHVGKADFLSEVTDKGAYLKDKLMALKAEIGKVVDVRGKGLMLGAEITGNPGEVIKECIRNGLLICSAGASTLRFVPPLIVTRDEIDQAVDIVKKALLA